jgi:glycosyltransferase involved in cell wall biosynthesis/predicted metal-dependent phosphoesterase TrpH
MDFVTITDHDTIDGVLQLADRPDVFVSEELTVSFRNEPQAVHVLCYGISAADHDWLQGHNGDVEACAQYLHSNEIACALAHPFFAVAAPLTPRHRRQLAELFPVWETRNGSRAPELNMPAAIYIDTHGGTGIAGSDDHAGIDIGRTFTSTPRAATPEEFLAHLREGHAEAHGDQGSAAKWAHSALALAARVVGCGDGDPDPRAVLALAERIVSDGDIRGGAKGSGLGPSDARSLLRAWLESVDLHLEMDELIELLQDEEFSHADLYRRARRAHERRLRDAVQTVVEAAKPGGDFGAATHGLFQACTAAIPYAPAAAFLAREKAKLVQRGHEPIRVGLVADGVGGMHGVTHTLEKIRQRGVPGFEVEVIGTDPNVDRRLSSVADVDIPYYADLQVGVPSLPTIVETLAEGRYELLHLCSPGPAGVGAALLARIMGLPTVGSYHTELGAYTRLRSSDPRLEAGMRMALSAFYGHCNVVLSPSSASDESLVELGIEERRIGRWDRGVDLTRFSPRKRVPGLLPGELNVLYVGRQTREKGADLLADAFLEAHRRDPRLRLVLAGGGPEQQHLWERLGDTAAFLGWLDGDALARVYASADVFLFASRTDTFGQVILEAQASGLPVVAVDEGGPSSLIADGVTGLLCPPDAGALASAVELLASSPEIRRRIATAAVEAVGVRSWSRSLGQLADGYRRALDALSAGAAARRAA